MNEYRHVSVNHRAASWVRMPMMAPTECAECGPGESGHGRGGGVQEQEEVGKWAVLDSLVV